MKPYTITLTITIYAEEEAEALEVFQERMDARDYDGDDLDIEED